MPRSKDPKTYELYKGYPRWKIERHKRLKPIREAMDKAYGPGNWGDDEIVADMLDRQSRKAYEPVEREKTHTTKITDKVKLYEKHFENITPNDRRMILQLVEIETQLEQIALKRASEKLTPQEMKVLGELEIKFSGEYRQIQSALGIDRASRETQIDASLELKKFVSGAKQLLDEQAVPIRCPYCTASNVNQGFILFHFRQDVAWKWVQECPKCHQTFIIASAKPSVGQSSEKLLELPSRTADSPSTSSELSSDLEPEKLSTGADIFET